MVTLVWGIDGWRLPPGSVDLEGSYLQDGFVHTPMHPLQNGQFEATIKLPAKSEINCGFWVMANSDNNYHDPLWDDNCYIAADTSKDAVFEYKNPNNQPTVLQKKQPSLCALSKCAINYHKPKKCFWSGEIEGWQPLPEDAAANGTPVIEDGVMKSPMIT